MEPPANIPPRFHPAYQHVQRLARYDRYQAALIFGSLARGEATDANDMDVKVVTDEDNPWSNINHRCARWTWRVCWMDNKHAN